MVYRHLPRVELPEFPSCSAWGARTNHFRTCCAGTCVPETQTSGTLTLFLKSELCRHDLGRSTGENGLGGLLAARADPQPPPCRILSCARRGPPRPELKNGADRPRAQPCAGGSRWRCKPSRPVSSRFRPGRGRFRLRAATCCRSERTSRAVSLRLRRNTRTATKIESMNSGTNSPF